MGGLGGFLSGEEKNQGQGVGLLAGCFGAAQIILVIIFIILFSICRANGKRASFVLA